MTAAQGGTAQGGAAPGELLLDRRSRRSLRSRAAGVVVQRVGGRYLRRVSSLAFDDALIARAAKLEQLAARRRPPRGAVVEQVDVDGLRAEWVRGRGVPSQREQVLLYLHGGGWFFGGVATHRGMVARLSGAAGARALVLDYRMVPHVDFEVEVEDCVRGYRWLLDQGTDPARITVMGDSAGGHLAFASVLRARAEGLPLPGAVVGISGVYDLDLEHKRAHPNAADPAGYAAAFDFLLAGVAGHVDPADPVLSPIRADLRGLPPVLLTAGSGEYLLSDAERMADRLAEAGVRTTLQVWDGQLHVFQAMPGLPEAREAVLAIGDFVRRHTGGQTAWW